MSGQTVTDDRSTPAQDGAPPTWTADQEWRGFEAAVAHFQEAFPGWWVSGGVCSVSCHCSVGPDYQEPEGWLGKLDGGFHADLPQPTTVARALRDCMAQALDALANGPTAHEPASEPSGPNT